MFWQVVSVTPHRPNTTQNIPKNQCTVVVDAVILFLRHQRQKTNGMRNSDEKREESQQ